jgi:hypothetical protein
MLEIWILALVKPKVQTYAKLLTQTQISKSKAYNWIFIGSLGVACSLTYLHGFIVNPVFPGRASQTLYLMNFLGQTIAIAVFLVFGLILIGGFIQVVARILGGTGSFEEFVYIFGAYFAPLGVISGIISFIPYIQFIGIILVIAYGAVLTIVAVKAVNQFDWVRAILTSAFIFLIGFICFTSYQI